MVTISYFKSNISERKKERKKESKEARKQGRKEERKKERKREREKERKKERRKERKKERKKGRKKTVMLGTLCMGLFGYIDKCLLTGTPSFPGSPIKPDAP